MESEPMKLVLPEKISTLVPRRFNHAKDGGHLVFSTTQLEVIKAAGLPVIPPGFPPRRNPSEGI